MGSSFKNSNNQRGSSSSSNSKPYALMLLLAFGAAILGVMVLHKIREKRIFTLLVKEKDHELLTLHLLFQREKEFNQEARKKIEEMNSKVYSLRTQKLELERRLADMESTISSLRDERKVIELTLEEKKNKIQILTENSSSEDPPQVTVLKDMLKMKDAEIEDLKLQLEKREDLHSETARLVTGSVSVGTRDESENEGDLQLSSDSFTDSTMGESRSHNGNDIQRVNDHSTNIELKKLNDVKDGVEVKNENTKTDDKETADYHADQGTKVTEDKAKETYASHEEKTRILQEHKATDDLRVLRGGLMLEKPDGSVNGYGSRARRRHSKGKRREVLRNRRLGDDLYSASKTGSAPVLNRNEEQQKSNVPGNNETEVKIYLGENHQLPLNHIPDTRNDGQSREEEAKKSEERGMKLKEMQSNRTEETEQRRLLSMEHNKNVQTKLITDDEGSKIEDVQVTASLLQMSKITNQLHDQEENREQEKIGGITVKKQEIDNEPGNEIVIEESDAEDSEDAETNEPEIDRDDIRRFSESDPDEEAEGTEF